MLQINKSKRLTNAELYPKEYHKTSIILHHTNSLNAEEAIGWWNQKPNNIGTAYVIERDGTVYEVFPTEAYAYHLGLSKPHEAMEKHSIGISLVSAGPLRRSIDNQFYFFPLWPNTIVNSVIPKDEIWFFNTPWRGYHFYQGYTAGQIEALTQLISHLCSKFNIKIQDKLKNWYEFDKTIYMENKPGIFSYSSVNENAKGILPHPNLLKALYGLVITMGSLSKNKVPSVNPYKSSPLPSSTGLFF